MKKFNRIGILGGSFNPIHLGHLRLAEIAAQQLKLDKVIFVVSYLPPHKRKETLAGALKRYQMVTLAIKGNSQFQISDIELNRKGISYSVDTVRQLKAIFGDSKLYFIVGSDFLKQFTQWKDIRALAKLCKFAVAQRAGYISKKTFVKMRIVTMNYMEISSSDIRWRIRSKKSIRYLVPEDVRQYILKKKLYC